MPLDGAEFFDDPALAKLARVECLLASENQWCKGAMRDRRGRHCLAGAIAAVGGCRELTKPILLAAREVSGRHFWRIQFFNDDLGTPHRDVLRVLERARTLILCDCARSRRPGWPQQLKEWLAGLLPPIGVGSAGLSEFVGAIPAPVLPKIAGGQAERDRFEPVRETADLCL